MANSVLGPMGAMRPASSDTAQQDLTVQGPPDVVRLSREFQVPRNVLMAIEERGDDPAAAAAQISETLKQGGKIEDVVPYAALVRAGDIADEIEGIEAEGGLGKAFGAGVDNLQSAYGSALEGVGKSLGIDGLADTGARIAENNAAEAASKSRGLTRMEDVDGLGSGGAFVGETVAQQVPQLGSTIGPVAAGAAVGSVVPGIGTGAGALAGGALALAQNLAQMYGFNRERQKEENDGAVNEAAAFGTAIPQAGIDFASDALVLTPLGLGPKAMQAGNIASRIMKGAGLGAATEAPTEAAQQAMERAQAGLAVTGKDARKEYIESAVAGGIVGGVFGGGRGAISRRRDEPEAVAEEMEAEERLALPSPTGGGTIFARPPAAEIDPEKPIALPSPTNGGMVIPAAPEGEIEDAQPYTRTPDSDGSVEGEGVDGMADFPTVETPSSPDTIPTRADEAPRQGVGDLAARATAAQPAQRTDDPALDFSSLSLREAEIRLKAMRDRTRRMKSPSRKLLATMERLAEVVEDKKNGADAVFEPVGTDPEPIKPVPASSKAVIEPIRQKAAVLRGVSKDNPPDVGRVSLKWDEKEKGFIFSRKHMDKVQEAIAAREAAPVADAAKQTVKDPTPAQAEAENYKTGKAKWRGLTLSVENEKGSVRSKQTPDGKTAWEVTMPAHYGRILGTTGADGDHVDFYMGDMEDSDFVLIVNQVDAETGAWDEHKVILGTGSEAQARRIYEQGFSDGKGKDRIGSATATNFEGFKAWLETADLTKPTEPVSKPRVEAESVRKSENPVRKSENPAKSTTVKSTEIQKPISVPEDGPVSVNAEKPEKPQKPQLKTGDVPLADYSGYEVNGYGDGGTREDGSDAPIKAAFLKDAMRYARKVASILEKEDGYKRATNRNGKAMVPVRKNDGGMAGSGDVYLNLMTPDGGTEVLLTINADSSMASKKNNVFMNLQFKRDGRFIGSNTYPDTTLAPSDLAAKIRGIAIGKASEVMAKRPGAKPAPKAEPKQQTDAEVLAEFAAADAQKAKDQAAAPQIDMTIFETEAGFTVDGGRAFIQQQNGESTYTYQANKLWDDAAKKWTVTARRNTNLNQGPTGSTNPPTKQLGTFKNADLALDAMEKDGLKVKPKPTKKPSAMEKALADMQEQQGRPKTPAARQFRDGDKVMVLFESPDREELMTIMGDAVNSPSQGRSYNVKGEGAGSVIIPIKRIRAATADDLATKQADKPAAGLLSGLSDEKQARAAELKAKLAAKVRNQTSAGLDPEYITLGGELVALYIEGGAKKFGQMLRDFAESTGLSLREAQAPMRAAYNHVRDDMDLAGQDISDMDDATAVMAEVRAALAEERETSQSNTADVILEGEPANEASNERDTDREDTPDDLSGVEGTEPGGEPDTGGRERGDGSGDSGGSTGGRDQGEPGDDLAGSVERDRVGDTGDETAERKGVNPGNFAISDDIALGAGTPGEKIHANLAAIRLVKTLEAENRHATQAEQETLARYVGWGGLKRVFDPRETGKSNQWGRTQAELRELLTQDQYRAARYSTAHAHYTSKEVVNAMWDAMRGFGFDGGRVLEPTVGTGNFIGLQPRDLAEKSDWYAAELDDLTGAMAVHLYPDATIFAGQGFENARFRPGTIDVAIGNPPFGSETLQSDLHPEIPPLSVHNYIIAKTGVLLRPGGIMGMVVTSRFLDTPNPQARSYLNDHFNFLGAVRLPNTAFKANAGTEVTTDIVWFQKRRDGEAQGDQSWLETGVERDGVPMNGYFAANPDKMLGKPSMEGTMYGSEPEFTLQADGRDLPAAMREALGSIKGSLSERVEQLEDAVVAETLTSDLAIGESLLDSEGRVMMRLDDDTDGNAVVEQITAESPWGPVARELILARDAIASAAQAIKDESVEDAKLAVEGALLAIAETGATAQDGSLKKSAPTGMGKQAHEAIGTIIEGLTDEQPYFGPAQKKAMRALREAVKSKVIGKKKLEALSGMLGLRRDTVALLGAEMKNDPNMENMRKALRRSYRAFVKKHGYVNDPANDTLVGGLPGAEAALEASYRKANRKEGIEASAKEAAILSERINKPYQRATKAASAADGIHISMRERGRLDMQHIADLTGKDMQEVIAELTGGDKPLVFFDPKRSDYVIADDYLSGNLAEKIKEARELGEPENVAHLERSLPEPKTADQITPSIRSMWMPSEVFEAFLSEMGAKNPKVILNMKAATIDVQASGDLSDFGQMFQTERKNPFDIFTSAVKGKSIVVYDRTSDNKSIKNEKATQDANAAAERMSQEFEKWAYLNPERRDAIVDAFNEKMNVIVPQKFDGVSYLTQVGANPQIELRNSQKNGAWRMMRSDSTLLHHVVGAGKTFTAITAIMERKRLGLSQKSMVVVPNHIVSQWARDFYALYPGANILAATEKDFQLANRRKLLARIATGNYDAVIIGHSSLRYIENNRDDTESLLNEQLADLEESLDEAKRSGASRSTESQIAGRIKKYKEKMEKILGKLQGDQLGFDFAAMGIDNLVIDEAHEFKNLEYATSGDRLVGMNNPEGSQRAFDLYIKTRGLRKRGGALGFLTGTPVSNSLVEIYTVMKYMIPQTMQDMGLMHFDSWASSFVQSKIRFEYTAAQKLKERNVLAGLNNLGPLSDLYKSFADIVMRADVERIYREQKEAENKKNGTNLPTRFPTPKVKGGGRRLVSLPSSPAQDEFTDYLVMRMGGIQANKSNKDYAKIDNALWVLSDARKASIDIRTIDPTEARYDQSKVVASGKEILRLADKWEKQRGTQLVFADSSVPLKNASKDIKAALREAWKKAGMSPSEIKDRIAKDENAGKPWSQQWGEAVEGIEARMDSGDLTSQQQDAIEEWMNGEAAADGAASAFTADTGFSFYDDLKAYLVEQGMAPEEVAFIHDYNTSDAKNALFEAVNEGKIRVLIGSTFKMGAGTNAQKRLVGLHHIDAPWRPSDMEQREGRIIRQGNELYEADPEGFEVEITAYTTEKTSDVVLWQVLERKAAGIEQFLNSTADRLVDEDGSDADSYAEFMAQSTGNPVFLRKMETEKAVKDTESAQASIRMVVGEARNFMSIYDDRVKAEQKRIADFEGVSFDAYADAGAAYERYRNAVRAFDAAKQKHEAETQKVREANKKLADGGKRTPLPKFEMSPPSLFDGKLDPYTARVKAAIEEARDTGKSGPIKLGDARLEVERKDTTADGVFAYDVIMTVKGQGIVGSLLRSAAVVKNPLNSRALTAAMDPASIRDDVAYFTRGAKRRLEQMKAAKPEMEKKAATEIDTKGLNKLKRDLVMYKGMVRVAEVEQSQSRLGKTNRFAQMDTKGRDLELKKSDDAPLLPEDGQEAFTFTNAGVTYTATLGAKGDTIRPADGPATDIYWFNATAEDGTPALVQVGRTQEKPGNEGEPAPEAKMEVLDVYDTSKALEPPKELRGGNQITPEPSPQDMRNITRDLNDEMERSGLAGKVSVRLVRKLVSQTTGNPIMGQAGRDGVTVSAASGAAARDVLRHEIVHALRSEGFWGQPYGLFTADEWRGMVRAARADKDIAARVREQYGDQPAAVQTEEMVAEMYREWAARRDAAGPAGKAFAKIRDFLMAMGSALRGRGFQSAGMTMERIASGAVGGRGPDGPAGGNAAMRDTPKEMRAPAGALKAKFKGLVGSAHWKDPRGFLSSKISDAMTGNGDYSLLALVPGRPLFSELGKRLISARSYLKHKEDMDQARNDWHSRADAVSQKWMGLRNKNQRANDTFMDLLHRSTIAQIDPTKPYDNSDTTLAQKEVAKRGNRAPEWAKKKIAQSERDKKTHAVLKRIYDGLPIEFRKLYKEVGGEYGKMADDFEDAVIENVKNSMRVALKRARKEHERAMRRINDDGLKGRERANAIAEADEALRLAEKRNGKGAASKIMSLRQQFESNRLKGPYFPLARFGQYFVVVRDPSGQVTSFSKFESETKQKAHIARMEKENPGSKIAFGVTTQKGLLRDQVSPTFVADVEKLLADADVSPELLDSIWQRWLETMPDQSIRTSKIHRKGRAGWNEDAFRAFGKHMFHGAHQLARLRYGVLLKEALDDARDEARKSDNPNRAGALVNEMEKRHEFTMNPTGSSVVASMSSLAFLWYLGASPAAAMVNISQTTIVGTPIMATRFAKAGVTGALKALTDATRDFGRGKGFAEQSEHLNADEKAAMREAYRRGTVDKTQAHDLASVAETGIEYNAVREKWMRRIGWMFHNAERMNREVTFLANYRLAKAEGMASDAAIDLAADLTWKIHFDYQNTSRPRFMQNDLGKILTTFRQFTVNMIYRMFRDAHQALHGATEAERREARGQLVGITLSMMAHAGIKGTWGYGIIMGLLALFMPGDSEDLENWLQDALLMEGDDPGTAAWNYAMGAALNGVPGQITGVSLTERLGMPNLWFRGPGRELEGRDLYAHYVAELLGPVYGIGEGVVRGAFAVADGEVMRGAETMVPKFIRDPMKTVRYAAEGVETWRGDPVVENVNPWELLLQANGFTPSRVAERYDINSRLKNRERKIMDERKELHNAATDPLREGEPIPPKVMERIRDFNRRFPEYPITGDTIRQSLRGRIRASQRNESGVSINPKLNQRLRSELPPPLYN